MKSKDKKKTFFVIEKWISNRFGNSETKGLIVIRAALTKVYILVDINISLAALLKNDDFNLNRNGLNEIIRICMLYILFPRDCSSIGQSTALSRRKLRVRAPSVPTDTNPITNKKIHQ